MAGFLDQFVRAGENAGNQVRGFLAPFIFSKSSSSPVYGPAVPIPNAKPVLTNLNPRTLSSATLTPKAQVTSNNLDKSFTQNPLVQKMIASKPVQDLTNLGKTASSFASNPVQTIKNIGTSMKQSQDQEDQAHQQYLQILNKVGLNKPHGGFLSFLDNPAVQLNIARSNFMLGGTASQVGTIKNNPGLYNKLNPQEKSFLDSYGKAAQENQAGTVMGLTGAHGEGPKGITPTEPMVEAPTTMTPPERPLQPTQPVQTLGNAGEARQTPQVGTNQLIKEAAGSSEPRILRQEPFVKNEPMNFNPKAVSNVVEATKGPSKIQQLMGATPENKLSSDIRETFSGTKNAQIVRGNQLADTIKKTVPNLEDRQGMFWYKAAQGDITKIEQALKDPAFVPYKAGLEKALNLPDNAKAALGLGEQYYTQAGQVSKDLGSIHNVVENYQNRIYEPTPPKTFVNSSLAGNIKTSTSHGLQRTFPDEFAAVEGGKKFATTDFADALAIHNQEMAGVNTSRQLTKAMSNAGLGKWTNPGDVPEGWKGVEGLQNKVPFNDAQGNPHIAVQQYAAPEHIANGLKAVTEPNFIKKVDSLRGIQKYQGLVKTVDLSYSFFHHLTETAQMLYQTKGGFDIVKNLPQIIKQTSSGEFNKLEQDFAQHTGMTAKIEANQDIMRNLNKGDDFLAKGLRTPGIKQAMDLAQKNSDFLFNKAQRYLKVMDYSQKMTSWVSKHPTATNDVVTAAKRSIAKEVNAAYGGLNWEAMGVTKSMQSLMRLTLLAPDWTVSNLQLGKMAVSGGPGGAAARSHVATALIGGVVTTEMLSKAITGHFTDQNPKGHEMEIQIAPDTYVSAFKGPIGDMMKLASNIADNGVPGGISRFTQGKTSPIVRTLVGSLSNKDYQGNDITKPGQSQGKNLMDWLSFAGKNLAPLPFGASTAVSQIQSGKATAPGVVANATGLARYAPKQFPSTPADKGNYLKQFTGTPQEKQQAQTQSANNQAMEKINGFKKGSPEQSKAIQDYIKTLPSDAEKKAFAYKLSTQGYSLKGIKTSDTSIKATDLYNQWSKLPPDQADAKAEQLAKDDPATYDALVREAKKANLSSDELKLTRLGVGNGERAKAILGEANKLGNNAAKNSYLKGLEDKGVITDPIKQQIMDLISSPPPAPKKQGSLMDNYNQAMGPRSNLLTTFNNYKAQVEANKLQPFFNNKGNNPIQWAGKVVADFKKRGAIEGMQDLSYPILMNPYIEPIEEPRIGALRVAVSKMPKNDRAAQVLRSLLGLNTTTQP